MFFFLSSTASSGTSLVSFLSDPSDSPIGAVLFLIDFDLLSWFVDTTFSGDSPWAEKN